MQEKIRLVLTRVVNIILLPITLLIIVIRILYRYFYPKKGMSIKDISTKEALPLIKEAEKDLKLQHIAKTFFEKIENDKELTSSWSDIIACRNFVVSSVGLKKEWGESCFAPKCSFYCPTCSNQLLWILYRKEAKGNNHELDYLEGYLSICPDCIKTIDFIRTVTT